MGFFTTGAQKQSEYTLSTCLKIRLETWYHKQKLSSCMCSLQPCYLLATHLAKLAPHIKKSAHRKPQKSSVIFIQHFFFRFQIPIYIKVTLQQIWNTKGLWIPYLSIELATSDVEALHRCFMVFFFNFSNITWNPEKKCDSFYSATSL